ncbi:TolB family protein [Marinobacterium jannaschii]|uniref:TolB family protein n=1 Tax=Marinobacterium jannaschii TaxID=64970 RepID=UPI0006889E8B|nr:PD40 domain-containing protein [Marinobacterium jannaschii]
MACFGFKPSVLALAVALSSLNAVAVDNDFDGLSDNEELALGLDLFNRDSDNDGIIDGLEYGKNAILSVNMATPYSTVGDSKHARLTPDGRKVVFHSNKPGLMHPDSNGAADIFLRDIVSGAMTLVSRNAAGAQCDKGAWDPEISADARYVAFSSSCTNLVNQTVSGSKVQVYVKDLQTGAVELISQTQSGNAAGATSQYPAISPDGRYVAFSSYASDLVATPAGSNRSDIYLYDRSAQTMQLVSANLTGVHSNGSNYNPGFSADGRFISFHSSASDLVPGDTNNKMDAFVFEIATGLLERVSVDSSGGQSGGASTFPTLSADGRYVVFTSWGQLSAADNNTKLDVYLHDRQTGNTELISLDGNGQSIQQHSIGGRVSENGRYVAFRSQVRSMTSDLMPPSQYPPSAGAIPTHADFFVYVKDRLNGTVSLVSQPWDVAAAAGGSVQGIDLAENGTVAFHATGPGNAWIEAEASPGLDVYIAKTEFIDNAGPELFAGNISAVDNTDWVKVELPQNYRSPVIVTTPVYNASSVPLVTRVRNVRNNSFEIRVQRTDDISAAVEPVQVNYLVAEEGVYNVPEHGIQMEATRFTSTSVDGKYVGWNGESRSYLNSYTSPVVLGQVQSANEASYSVFWSRGSAVAKVPDSILRVGRHIGEGSVSEVADESVGYMVFEAGTGVLGDSNYQALTTADYIRGMGNGSYNVGLSTASDETVVISSATGMDGRDGGWPVVIPDSTDASGVRIAVDEDQAADNERKHTTEQVAVFAFTPQ